ncbi:MAG: DMT family transporter [Wolinella sp.]
MHPAFVPYIALILAMIFWGSSFIALKYAFMSYDSTWVIFGRLLIATLAFAPFIPKMNLRAFRSQDSGMLLAMALFEPCLYFIFESKAIENTTASQAGMISSMLPVLVALFAFLFLGERIKKQMIAGFLLAMLGACWLSLSSSGNDYAPNPLLGNLLEFIAVLCAAFFTIIVKHLSSRYNALFLTGFQSFAGAIFFAFLVFLSPNAGRMELHLGALGAIFYLGIAVSFGGYGLYNYALGKISASIVAGFVNLIPIFSLLFAYLLLDERLNLMQSCACSLIFIGIGIALYRRRSDSRR